MLKTIQRFFTSEVDEQVVLDLGASFVKGLYRSNKYIKTFFIEKNRGDAIKVAADALKKNGLLSKSVTLVLKGQDTLVRNLSFPRVDRKNLKEAVTYELAKYIPYHRDEVYLDICLIDENYKPKEFFIFVALAKKSFIDTFLKGFQEAKIAVSRITLNNVALINLFLHCYPHDINVALVDIGLHSTLLNLVSKGIPCLSREIKVSAETLLTKLSQQKNISLSEAENYCTGLRDPQEIMDLVEDACLELSEELKNSLDYLEINWGQRIGSIYLTGGFSKMLGIDKLIGEALNVETKIWNPFEKLDLRYEKNILDFKDKFCVALGAAL